MKPLAAPDPVDESASDSRVITIEVSYDTSALELALAGRFVTRVIYLEDPNNASPVARRMVDIMARKARAGVKVRVSYDAIGSISGDRAMYAPLLDAGDQLRHL